MNSVGARNSSSWTRYRCLGGGLGFVNKGDVPTSCGEKSWSSDIKSEQGND